MRTDSPLLKAKAMRGLWADPVWRTQAFFGRSPFHEIDSRHMDAYQLGAYLYMWGEVYGFPRFPREICPTGRGTGKTTVFQELNGADMGVFLPFFLQQYYGEKKPIDVTIVFVANVKAGARARLQNVKNLITANPILERELVDLKQWTKERCVLRNGTTYIAAAAADRIRGLHAQHTKGKVIYLEDEFAFWGGSQCMDGQKFNEEIAEQSFGACIGAFTTPYGKRGGAWWAFNHPDYAKFSFPTTKNPRADLKALARKVKRLRQLGRHVIVDQEILGKFVDDVGLFFTMEVWLKSINAGGDWVFSDQDNYQSTLKEVTDMFERGERRQGRFLLGLDPNSGSKKAGADPFGINLTQKVGNKYFNRFATAYEGRSHDEIMRLLKPLCKVFEPEKINIDGGGGYDTGPTAMLKGSPGVRNMTAIVETNKSIVEYMSKLRALMMLGRYEQPVSEDLREAQLSMTSIGDKETEDENDDHPGRIYFQTRGKKNGIPCNLAAMGLSVARENIGRVEIALSSDSVSANKEILKPLGSSEAMRKLGSIGDMGLSGIQAGLCRGGGL